MYIQEILNFAQVHIQMPKLQWYVINGIDFASLFTQNLLHQFQNWIDVLCGAVAPFAF